MYGYNAGPPMAIPIYRVLPYCVMTFSPFFLLIEMEIVSNNLDHPCYIHSTTVLCDTCTEVDKLRMVIGFLPRRISSLTLSLHSYP